MPSGIALVVRRTIRANVDRVFDAFTKPEQLRAWWGPRPVTCLDAEVDLSVGGRLRIVNGLPDGGVVTIYGEFLVVQPPHKLVYTWRLNDAEAEASRVTVTFAPRGAATEVVVVHEDIPSDPIRKSHEDGWRGCLDGLELHFG